MDYVRESYSAGAEQLPVLMVFLIQILFPIFIIPKQRMPCKGHLAAYLMRAPCFQPALYQRQLPVACQNARLHTGGFSRRRRPFADMNKTFPGIFCQIMFQPPFFLFRASGNYTYIGLFTRRSLNIRLRTSRLCRFLASTTSPEVL